MQQKRLFGPLRILSFAVMALMGGAILYAATMAITYWSGIGV